MSKRKSNFEHSNSSASKKASVGYWKDGLSRATQDPALVIKSDELTVTIRDKFPKVALARHPELSAKHHFLIVPKNGVPDLQSLTSDHINLLEHMEKEAFLVINSHSCGLSSGHFSIGYHAIPSMRPLHLHVISKDFDSPCLKTKKHWNSFTSDFFRNSSDILEELKREGKIQIEKERFEVLLKNNLSCHWCNTTQRNIPNLKSHIRICVQNKLAMDKSF